MKLDTMLGRQWLGTTIWIKPILLMMTWPLTNATACDTISMDHKIADSYSEDYLRIILRIWATLFAYSPTKFIYKLQISDFTLYMVELRNNCFDWIGVDHATTATNFPTHNSIRWQIAPRCCVYLRPEVNNRPTKEFFLSYNVVLCGNSRALKFWQFRLSG